MARVWRLRPGGEFGRVRQNGRAWPHRFFILIVQARADQLDAPPRLGIAAGKRLGNAVLRNRLKRRLREGVRQVYPNLITGIDLVIIARAPLEQATAAEVVAAVTKAFQQAGVWRDQPAGDSLEQSPTGGGREI
jgi:ribonuclease P protein component